MDLFEINSFSSDGIMPGNSQFPIRPISAREPIGESSHSKDFKHAQEHFVTGNYLGAMKICRAILANKKSDYEAQLLLAHAMASYKMLLSAEAAFRAAIETNEHDTRGWQGLCELLEESDQKTATLFNIYLNIMTFAKPKSRLEWINICDKALKLHKDLGGKPSTNVKLETIKRTLVSCPNYNIHNDVVISRWRELIYASPKKQAAEVDQMIMKAACRLVKDHPGSNKMDQMKCDILYTLTCKPKWAEVEAKCIMMHKIYPLEKLPLEILARQYIKSDPATANTKDMHLQIYQDLYDVDNTSPLAAIGFGQALATQRSYPSAITWLTKGLSIETQCVHGWLYLARARLALKNLGEAHKSSVKGLESLKMKPSSSSTRSLKSQLESIKSQSAGPGDNSMSVIEDLVETIPVQMMKKQTPSEHYRALVLACKCLHQQRGPIRQSGDQSLQEWRRGKRSEYNLQHATKYWEAGMETRTDPWMFLTAILKALKQDPWSADVFHFIGRYLWEILAELSLAKEFFELSYQLRPDCLTCSYLVDICMVLKEKHTAIRVITDNLQSFPNAKWSWLRLGLIQMIDRNHNLAEQSFWNAINADSRADRQPYECLARNRLHRLQVYDARLAFADGAKFQSFGFQPVAQMNAGERATLEASDIRAMYSDTQLWTARPHQLGVQFAFSILFAICPDLLRPIGSDFNRVARARKDINNVYKCGGLCHAGKRNDWGDAGLQCAYMLRFFLIHCQFLPRLLSSCPKILSRFPKGNHIRVCCVGGGPGSDIIGLLIFLRSIDRSSRLTCHVLDKFPAWENVWRHIQPRLPPPTVDATYSSLDMMSSSSLDRRTMEIIGQADIVTFVKSVSTVSAFLKTPIAAGGMMPQYPVKPVVSQRGAIPPILRALKKGALVIFIDNRIGDQNSIFREMAEEAGLKAIHNSIWRCDIEANTQEYNAVWNSLGNSQACPSCNLHGYIAYKP